MLLGVADDNLLLLACRLPQNSPTSRCSKIPGISQEDYGIGLSESARSLHHQLLSGLSVPNGSHIVACLTSPRLFNSSLHAFSDHTALARVDRLSTRS